MKTPLALPHLPSVRGVAIVVLVLMAAKLRADPRGEADRFLAAADAGARVHLARAAPRDSARAIGEEISRRVVVAVREGRLDEADHLVACAFELASGVDDSGVRARALLARGVVRERRSDHAGAEQDFLEARALCDAAADPRGGLDARNHLGRLYADTSRFPEAIAELEGCAAAAKDLADVAAEARARLNLGETLRQKGDYEGAMISVAQARELFVALGDELGAAESDQNYGAAAALKNDYATALPAMERALATYRKLDDRDGIAGVLGNLGVVHEMLGRYSEALALHRESVAMRRAQGLRRKEALAQNNIGVLFLFSGRPREALAEFEACLVIAREVGDRALEQVLLHNSGEALRNCGEFGPAMQRMLAALEIARELEIRPAVAAIRASIASVYHVAGLYEKAASEFESIAAEFHELDMPMEEAASMQDLGSVFETMGRDKEARALMERSLELKRSIEEWNGVLVSLEALGRLDLDEGELARAGERFAESGSIAERLGDFGGAGRALVGQGRVALLEGRDADAAGYFSRALETGLRSEVIDVIVPAATGLADVERKGGNLEPAAAAYERAIAAIEGSRESLADPEFKIGFLERHLEPYHALAAMHLEAGRAAQAWRVIERARARTLLQMLAGSHVDIMASLTETERARSRELAEQIDLATMAWRSVASQAEPAQDELERVTQVRGAASRAFDAHRSEMHLRHPGLAARRGETPSATIDDLAALLPDRSVALVEYAVVGDAVWVFLARRESPAGGVMLRAQRLEASIATIRAKIQECVERCEQRSSAGGLDVVRRELFTLLLGPVAGGLDGVEVLGISPEDAIWRVPFAALMRPDGSSLVDHHALFVVPSVATWREMDGGRRASAPVGTPAAGATALLALANPDLGATRHSAMPLLEGFEAIPGTERQAREIAALFGAEAALFLGRDATEARVRGQGGSCRVLHLATHGIFDPASPLHSGLLLTPSPGDDGYLEAREMMELDLHAELVVLSACRTARGDVRGGEGVWGMSWALFVAGSPSSVLTHWSVADESTAECMVSFYRGLQPRLARGVAERPRFWKARCLWEAQKALRANPAWSEPFHWAPFVLVGDPG